MHNTENLFDIRTVPKKKVLFLQARAGTFQPGNFTGCGSEDDDEVMLNVLRCRLTYQGQAETNAEARFNKSLRPRKPEGSLGRTAQDVHLGSHTAPEL